MKKPLFEFYERPNGHNEYLEFYNTLTKKQQAKLSALIKKVEEEGLIIAKKMRWVSKLDDNIFELRSEYESNIQRVLYFHVKDSRFIVTHGFSKKTQKTPPREIKHAKEIRAEFEKEELENGHS